jgi:hypothetical protein
VDADEFAEGVEDGVGVGAGGDGGHVLHLGDGRGGGRDDVGEAGDAVGGRLV